MTIPILNAKGLLFIGDPHVADNPPGHRLAGYREQILDKIAACLDHARTHDLVPYFLGDLFHWPRENSNGLIVELIELFRPHKPFVLVGNHDKHLARLTPDLSISVLDAAGVIRLISEPGPVFRLDTPEGSVLVCATPDGFRLPRDRDRLPDDPDTVIWTCHHNLQFPEFLDRAHKLRELPGIDWVVNGHIHRPQQTVIKGGTIWANPGNISRLTFSRRSKEREPAASIWKPGLSELEKWIIPHLDFHEVFPRQEFPPEEQEQDRESKFLQGLERLAWKRTTQGEGIKRFLEDNLEPDQPENTLIWSLYEEVIGSGNQQ